MIDKERKQRALIVLHDLGSRDGATAKTVRAAMREEGFTDEEIREAVLEYSGQRP